jgi:hypothetical protein
MALFVFLGALVLAAAATRSGLLPNDAVVLWAGAISAADGEMSVGGIAAAYPTLPFLATALAKLIVSADAPAPALLGATLVGLLAGSWLRLLRDARMSIGTASAVTMLLVFHPALLRASAGGPAEILVVLFLYLVGVALYRLRARSGVPETMAVGLALLGLAFSHPMGAAIAVGAIPFLVFAVRPALVAGSAINIVLTLMFPTIFAAAAFTYVSWVFPGDGWSFFTPPAESLSGWAAGFAHGFPGNLTGVPALDAGIAVAIATLIGAPIVPIAILWVRRRHPLTAPVFVLAATITTAGALAVATQLAGNPAILAVAAPVLAAIVLTRVPIDPRRHGKVVLALAVGWLGGAASLVIVDPRIAAQAATVIAGGSGDSELADALALGGATIRRDDVLIDSVNSPAVVVGRGDGRGLLSPASEAFRLATLFARVNSPFVAVPDPDSRAGAQDRLNKTFPRFFHNGDRNYRIVYQNSTWRLFGRVEVGDLYKD